MNKRNLKNLEWGIFICCLILVCIGIVALYSATQGDSSADEFQKQVIWVLISIPIMIIIIFIDYNLIARISPVLYGIAIIALVAVLFTEPINGASSWFKISENVTIQPSEFAKVILIIFLSFIIAKLQKNDKTEINKIWKILLIGIAARNTNWLNCFTTRLWNCYGICCSSRIYAICIRNRQKIYHICNFSCGYCSSTFI